VIVETSKDYIVFELLFCAEKLLILYNLT